MIDIKQIEKYALELQGQINQLTEFSSKLDEMLLLLKTVINRQSSEVLAELQETTDRIQSLEEQLVLKGMPGINRYESDLAKIKEMITSDDWPKAVPDEAIPQSESDKIERAETILDIFVTEHLEGLRILDVGCGEGHVARAASERGALKVVGYDIEEKWNTPNTETLILTTEIERAKKNAPFDVVIIYDVIDHIKEADPVGLLNEVKNSLTSDGRIYLRTHPWCSRHGGHLYDKINKAFLHMCLDETELLRLFGVSTEEVYPITQPTDIYRKWIKSAGLVIKDESMVTQKVEDFFLNPPAALRKRLEYANADLSQMSIEYVDYILEANDSNQKVF